MNEIPPEELNELKTPTVEYTVVSRAGWGAQESKSSLKPLKHPIKNILMAFNTNVEDCTTKDECKERMRQLQQMHLDKGLPDMHYNFTVGGDGNIYEGRGWNYQPEPFKENSQFDETSICVGVLGDSNDPDPENPFPPLIHALYLANYGVEQKFMEDPYEFAEDEQKFDS
ncbi:peptidoglycan recognition protein 4-like isoform X2 [Macrosteles quadrilineatus]|uniref:peptidoglycan recognition protein 4-like isoform X2 n=1 Tax=Macrosteles quadrilineatus TaxID=74068 RepID=UPI0023E0D755|nr:peptidoglycan recognition protein 4-like isoform X2 [Macrosteles quadrilineatus]